MMEMLWKMTQPRVIHFLYSLIELDRKTKLALILSVDAALCVFSVWIAFSLRLGFWELWSPPVATVIVASISLWLPIFLVRGIYRSVVRFIGSRTILDITTSCLIMSVILAILFFALQIPNVPRTISVLQPMLFLFLLVTFRLIARYILFDLLNKQRYAGDQSRVLIYGAGSAGRQLAEALRHEPGMLLCCYVDDKPGMLGQHLNNVKIYDDRNLTGLVERLEIDTVLLAMPSISRLRREQIIRKFAEISVRVLTLPAIGRLIDGSISVSDLREIQISDLLGRDPVPPNRALLDMTIANRVVLVTGAGGSIGSELCRQISEVHPSAIILVEMTEHSLYSIDAELREARDNGTLKPSVSIHAELGNIAHRPTARRLFERWRPDTIFHAAAYKHVPMVEENVIAGMWNNIFGTLYCALEAKRIGAQHFVLVSTDKAVRPTNVMGASKRACELILQALAENASKTRFAMVRFGNVLGSSGSVVPRFQRQIKAGGPVTITHRDVTRYFMTIPEAAQLVIQAGAMAKGGEVFVLDMGEPIRIYDMARTMIHLSGLHVRDAANPDGDIEIWEVGLRKGEKLYEELLIGGSPQVTSHPRIMQAVESHLPWAELITKLDRLETVLVEGERNTALELLSALVPEYDGQQAVRTKVA